MVYPTSAVNIRLPTASRPLEAPHMRNQHKNLIDAAILMFGISCPVFLVPSIGGLTFVDYLQVIFGFLAAPPYFEAFLGV
jgi:hypothetical protein